MKGRGDDTRPEFLRRTPQRIDVVVKHPHRRTQTDSRARSSACGYARADYKHLTRHYAGHSSEQYAFALLRVGKQRRGYGYRRATVDFGQNVGKRRASPFIFYQVEGYGYDMTLQQRAYHALVATRCPQQRQHHRPAPQGPRVALAQSGRIDHYVTAQCLRARSYLHPARM